MFDTFRESVSWCLERTEGEGRGPPMLPPSRESLLRLELLQKLWIGAGLEEWWEKFESTNWSSSSTSASLVPLRLLSESLMLPLVPLVLSRKDFLWRNRKRFSSWGVPRTFWWWSTWCLWEKVPLSTSWPDSRTWTPCFRRDPKAMASAKAQSTVLCSTISMRPAGKKTINWVKESRIFSPCCLDSF